MVLQEDEETKTDTNALSLDERPRKLGPASFSPDLFITAHRNAITCRSKG
jgi:hypothetical protein